MTPDSTPGRIVERATTLVAGGVSRVRDRRRRVRRRLEDIFNRETFTSVAVVGAMGKLIETSVVPFIDPLAAVSVGRAGAWLVVFFGALAASVYWERLARAAEATADAAENVAEAVEGDSDGS